MRRPNCGTSTAFEWQQNFDEGTSALSEFHQDGKYHVHEAVRDPANIRHLLSIGFTQDTIDQAIRENTETKEGRDNAEIYLNRYRDGDGYAWGDIAADPGALVHAEALGYDPGEIQQIAEDAARRTGRLSRANEHIGDLWSQAIRDNDYTPLTQIRSTLADAGVYVDDDAPITLDGQSATWAQYLDRVQQQGRDAHESAGAYTGELADAARERPVYDRLGAATTHAEQSRILVEAEQSGQYDFSPDSPLGTDARAAPGQRAGVAAG